MTTWQYVLITINSIASLAVLWVVVCATNNMGRRTPFTIRLAFILLGLAAMATLLAPGYLDRTPTISEALFTLGIATLFLVDRRRGQARALVKP